MFDHDATAAHAAEAPILDAARRALRQIPPAVPLEATVAVNPFLGQTGEDLATAAARLGRAGAGRVTRPRGDFAAMLADGRITEADLAAALAACPHPNRPASNAALRALAAVESPAPRPLPTVADLAARVTGTDWPAVAERCVGLWAAGHFDRGQALWPAPAAPAWDAWRAWARRDRTPDLAGLTGFRAFVADLPEDADSAIQAAARVLGLPGRAAESVFHRLLTDLGGWAQHARWLSFEAERDGGTEPSLKHLLAIRLTWEAALFALLDDATRGEWRRVLDWHGRRPRPTEHQVTDAILQEAAERAEARRVAARLGAGGRTGARPTLQAAFCIDVRSEVFRRALESVGDGVETLGFAGFFGLPAAHSDVASDLAEPHLPVLLSPGLHTRADLPAGVDADRRIAARARRAWGRFRQAAVSSFAFVEAAGPLYAPKILRDALGHAGQAGMRPPPRLDPLPDMATRARLAAQVLRAMSMTDGHARLVLLLGHGASTANNPHESAYHCGACGGHTGEVPARLLARLLNDPETRAGLAAEGIVLPEDTLFVAGLHDTTTDRVTLFEDTAAPHHADDLGRARAWLEAAGARARAERAPRLPGATPETLARRAADWAEVRPEWGLAGCAAFVAAPRSVTRAADLGGRAFLHSYDWRQDEGYGTLRLILTAPVVVASWISLQYYGSAVAPEAFGGGNKLIHNVTGGIGVVEGNGGRLRPGLPRQALHDGAAPVHEPLRLTVMVEAPQEAIEGVLAEEPGVRALFDNGWLHLVALNKGQAVARLRPGGGWEALLPAADAARAA